MSYDVIKMEGSSLQPYIGGGTDFSLGGRVSETMALHDGPKLGSSGGMLPQEFFKYRCYKINSGAVLALSIPHSHVSNCNKLRFS